MFVNDLIDEIVVGGSASHGRSAPHGRRRGGVVVSGHPARAWSRRDDAVAVVDAFKVALRTLRRRSEVQAALEQVQTELVARQNGVADRPHLAKSLCQVATAVRRRGSPDLAVQLLEWSIDGGVADAYLFNELILSHLVRGEIDSADAALSRARRIGLATSGHYRTLVGACGRTKDLARAQRLFAQADADGLVDGFLYAALIDVYGKAGHAAEARATFDQAQNDGCVISASYTALMIAHLHADDVRSAETVFAKACERGVADTHTYTALLSACGKAGDVTRAQALFDEADAAGLVDALTFRELLLAYALAGDVRNAGRIFRRARQRGIPGAVLRPARQEAYRTAIRSKATPRRSFQGEADAVTARDR